MHRRRLFYHMPPKTDRLPHRGCADFPKQYNGTTAQNMNHIINRVKTEKFCTDDLERMCEILKVDYDYLIELCEEIQKKLEAK